MDKLILTLKRLRVGISFVSVIVTVVLFVICREQAVSWRGNGKWCYARMDSFLLRTS